MNSSRARDILFTSVLVIVSLFFLYLLTPFVLPLFWAAVIASIFRPLYLRFNRRWNRPSMCAALTFLIIALIIILPGIIIGSLLFAESMRIYESLGPDGGNVEKIVRSITRAIKDSPYFVRLHIDEQFWTGKVSEIGRGIASYMLEHLKNLTQNTVIFLAQFAVMLYTLFFFIRDGDAFLGMLMRLFSLGEDREKILYERFVVTAKSTLKVTLIIGGIQGTLGGFIFWATGIEGALVWGVVMVFMSIVPVVGCSIVWVPAGVVMLLMGHVWKGVLILSYGAFVISMVDNLLRPMLIGRDVQMHPLLIFLSTLGGITLLGFSGFVIGPIITSLLLALWAMYDITISRSS
ncbi:MAG: AI-2E family transporter [Deltaproteobacteria bacterium]|nr:AI-2E family transporter [Deltaproteobacteria bacterium]